MSNATVTTQAELDKALKDKIDWIDINSPAGVWLEVRAYGSATDDSSNFLPTNECGNGLHFGPTPTHALAYHPEATRFMAAQVAVKDLVPITGSTAKCKAPRVVAPLVEVTVDGKPVKS